MKKDKKLIYHGLGFPVILVGFTTKKFRGETLPDVNFKELQARVFEALLHKSSHLNGCELLFVRTFLGMTQTEFSKKIGLANHSRVSQWEKKGLKPTGMDNPAELSVRLLMASAIEEGLISEIYKELSSSKRLEKQLPVEVRCHVA